MFIVNDGRMHEYPNNRAAQQVAKNYSYIRKNGLKRPKLLIYEYV